MPAIGPELIIPFTIGEAESSNPALFMHGNRPPLALQGELVFPDGTSTRWDSDAKLAKDQATGVSFRTQRYTGFADAQLTLHRRIDLDYPDLGLLQGINLIGHDGAVAYEGRIGAMPRSLQTGPEIAIQAQGWMSHAKDEPFVEVYVDRDLGSWTGTSRARQVLDLTAERVNGNWQVTPDEVGAASISVELPGTYKGVPFVRTMYVSPCQILLGAIYVSQSANSMPALWAMKIWSFPTDSGEGATEVASFGTTPNAGLQTLTVPAPFVSLEASAPNTTKTEDAQYLAHWKNIAVYGTHGLTRRGEEPGGFYVSDLMTNIANRFAPKLDTSAIQGTTFAVPQASFTSETLPYDAFQTLNAYHRWEMAVYEKRRLSYWPIDLNDYDWEVRTSDPGTTVSLQGDDTANLCNGVIVRYTDLNTGYEARLSPDVYPELRDESPDNPANLNGLKLYTGMSLSAPTTKTGALQMGRTFLAEFNQAQAPGSITIAGHIRDRAGHWQQGWKVRASDRLIISDLANDAVRIVGETTWDHDSKQLTIAVDSSFKRLDAILARLGVAIEASNLSLP